MAINPNQYLSGYSGLSASDLAGYLRRSFTSSEMTQADFLIESIEVEIASQCRRQFAYGNDNVYVESFDLPHRRVFTSSFPIREIKKISVSGEELSLDEGEDYVVYDSHLEFINQPTSSGTNRKALEIEYTIRQFWGNDVTHLILKLAGQAWLNAEDGGVSKREFSFASVRQAMDTDKFHQDVKQIISRYQKKLV